MVNDHITKIFLTDKNGDSLLLWFERCLSTDIGMVSWYLLVTVVVVVAVVFHVVVVAVVVVVVVVVLHYGFTSLSSSDYSSNSTAPSQLHQDNNPSPDSLTEAEMV